METGRMKLALSAGALALSMALAGCGGGGSSVSGDQPTPPGNPPPPAPRTVSLALVSDSNDAYEAPDVGEYTLQRGANPSTGENIGSGEIDFTCLPAAGQSTCVITVVAASSEPGGVTIRINSGMRVTASNSAKLQMAVDDAPVPPTVAELRARSERAAKAIEGYALPGTDPSEIVSDFAIERITGDAKITLNRSDAEKKDRPLTESNAFNVGDGWMGRSFGYAASGEVEDGKVRAEAGVVYTNIEANKELDWLGNEGLATLGNIAVEQTAGATEGQVTITAASQEFNVEHFSGAIVPNAPSGEEESSTKPVATGGVTGTLYGVAGRFTCSGGCTVTRNDKGKLTFSSDVIFNPDASDLSEVKAQAALPDPDYLRFGYWITDMKDSDGKYVVTIETFASGIQPARTLTETNIEGKATYSGAAAGWFVQRTFSDGEVATITDGPFVANASLEATFGQITTGENAQTLAPAELHRIKGTISDFRNTETNTAIPGWELTLKTAVLGTAGVGVTLEDYDLKDITGMTEGSTGGQEGWWAASMFGTDESTTGAAVAKDHPTGVAGEFRGHFHDGSVAGAFGATKD